MSAALLGAAWAADMGTHVRKLVLMKLVDEARDDGTSIFPSLERIAKAAQASVRHVRREMRNFELAGLVTCVDNEGGGRGMTRVYTLHLDVLERVRKVGFALVLDEAMTAREGVTADAEPGAFPPPSVPPPQGGREEAEPAENPDTMSAFNDGEKADMGDTKGGHGEHQKADTRVRLPLKRPLDTPVAGDARERAGRSLADGERPGTRSGGGSSPPPSPAERHHLAELRTLWQTELGTLGNEKREEGVWGRLTPDERVAAHRRASGWIAIERTARGKRGVPALTTYLADRLFARAPDPDAADPVPVTAELKGQAWWALFWRFRLDAPERAKFMAAMSREKNGYPVRAEELPDEAERGALVKIEKGSAAFAAWMRQLREEGLRIDEHFACGVWIWVPAPEPGEAGESEMRRTG